MTLGSEVGIFVGVLECIEVGDSLESALGSDECVTVGVELDVAVGV